MLIKYQHYLLLSLLIFITHTCTYAAKPFYFGVTSGYGATTWSQIVPTHTDAAMELSTPIHTQEGGIVWGLVAGYEILPVFALQLSYIRYPDATIYYSPLSLFTFDYGVTQFTSHTETVALTGKYIIYIPHTALRSFSSAGVARLHRYDFIRNSYRLSPTFALGFIYPVTPHVQAEIAFNYTAGYGESEIDPVEHYMPFLYAGVITLSYHF